MESVFTADRYFLLVLPMLLRKYLLMISTSFSDFVVLIYSRTSDQSNFNCARKQLFSPGSRAIESIPPTEATLQEHCKRAIYQGGYVWVQYLVLDPKMPSPADWGWEDTGDDWHQFWTSHYESATCNMCQELIKCGCKRHAVVSVNTGVPNCHVLIFVLARAGVTSKMVHNSDTISDSAIMDKYNQMV